MYAVWNKVFHSVESGQETLKKLLTFHDSKRAIFSLKKRNRYVSLIPKCGKNVQIINVQVIDYFYLI